MAVGKAVGNVGVSVGGGGGTGVSVNVGGGGGVGDGVQVAVGVDVGLGVQVGVGVQPRRSAIICCTVPSSMSPQQHRMSNPARLPMIHQRFLAIGFTSLPCRFHEDFVIKLDRRRENVIYYACR